MEKEVDYKEKLREIRLKDVLYIVEHKETSPEIARELKEIKHEIMKNKMENKGEDNNDKHKRRWKIKCY